MSSDRKNQTLADWVALAISPALIMGLVASLVFFLINVLYAGEYVERLRWILFFFVFGAVLLARMTMRDDTSSRTILYGVPLGFLTWLGMQMFVEYPEGGIKELSWIINAGLIGLVWWCAHRLTWDCTNIDEETDINAEGLLQAAGLENEPDHESSEAGEKPEQPAGWLQRWRNYREKRDKKRILGVWVVYFSLAALPLFGLGQALIDASEEARRRTSFWLMIVYVGCGLGLLLTTCFLSLRRYLRQRNLQMPAAMTGVWLTAGGMLIAALLVVGAVLPRPDAEYSLFNFSPAKSPKRDASNYAMKGGQAGKDKGNPGADDPQGKKDSADNGGKQGQQKGERGAPVQKGEKGSGGKGDKSGKNGDDKGEKSGPNQNPQKSGQNKDKGDPASGKDRAAPKDNDAKKAKGDGEDRKSSNNDDKRSDSNSTSKTPSAAALREFMSKLGPALKWIIFALIGAAVLFFLLRSGLQFLANFTEWARRLLAALRNFWANLFGGWSRTKEEVEENETEERTVPERPFASYRNPFDGGKNGMAAAEMIRYTFAAAQAWARERDLERQPGETPQEFADRVGVEVPALEAELHRLAVLYARAVYARGGLPANSVEVLRQFWQRLEAVAEQPLSA